MYLGNQPTTGENNNFKILDDILSYTETFNGSSASVVSVADDTLTFLSHRFITGQRVTYSTTGTAIGGLVISTAYFVIKNDQNTIKLASTFANANNNVAIDLTALGTGTTHTLIVAFDSINTKFKASFDNGTKALITRAAQLQISINGVIQQPQDTTSPTNGFGIDLDGVIIFSTAPANTDIFWGNVFANNFATFDISDNTVDTFTGNGSLVNFTLSKIPANNQNLLVTIDGVVQYPSDNTTIRAYGLSENILTFVGAPGNATAIQVRHIGFAGATSSSVTGFYGRTGNVGLTTADTVSIGAATIGTGGIGTSLLVQGNARITGILTVGTGSITLDGSTNIINVGTGVTLSSSGINVTGIITATTFSGNLTGNVTGTVSSSGIATFSGGVVVSAGTTAAPSISPSGDSNTGVFFPAADTIAFSEGGSEVVRIDSSGRVGINSTSPERKLDVVDSGANGSVIRSRVTTNNGGYLAYEALNSSGTSMFSVNHNGGITLAGNVIFASGQGLDFSATANSSGTMTSELLNDYEEGTFTPVIAGETTAGTATYTRQAGVYTKIGREVFYSIDIIYSLGTGTGFLKITGLPFTSSSTSMIKTGSIITDNITLTASNYPTVTLSVNATQILVQQLPVGGGSGTQVTYDAAGQITVMGRYFV